MTPPKKIGVLGPPGVGKTKFARALRRWEGWDEGEEPTIIDNYAQALKRKTGLALGPWAAYVENFMVAGKRMELEAAHAMQPTITVGTIVDSLMYALIHSDGMLHSSDLDARRVAYMQAQNAMQAMSMWYTEVWDYHLAFALSYPPSHQGNLGWPRQYAAYMPEVFETFAVPGVVQLPAGPLEDQIRIATEVIELATQEEDRAASPETPSAD